MHRILEIGHLKNYCHSDFGLLLQFKHVYVEKGSKRGGVQPLEKSKKNKNLEKQEICKHEICRTHVLRNYFIGFNQKINM